MSPKTLLLLLFFVPVFCLSQKAKKVVIQCDVLGKKHESVRYYHPVEGRYDLVTHRYFNDKQTAKRFTDCVFIDPTAYLTDSVTVIRANSLRHYIDPSELVYIDWQWESDTSNEIKAAELKKNAGETIDKKYQQVVEDYFRPFYLRKWEVTNAEYREFVLWVRDSIFKEAVFGSGEFSDEELFSMLNMEEDQVYYDEENLEWVMAGDLDIQDARDIFPFRPDFDIWKEFEHQRLLPVLEEFYLHPNERWYKRREIDVTKLNYAYYWVDREGLDEARKNDTVDRYKGRNSALRNHTDGTKFIHKEVLNIYPDTLTWVKDASYFYNDPMTNMYFWHPAYDLYPVVGISREQAVAFLHWKHEKLMAQDEFWLHYEIGLPTAYEYEWAVCHTLREEDKIVVQDNELVTTLLTGKRDGAVGRFHEMLLRLDHGFTEKVYRAFDTDDKKEAARWKKEIEKAERGDEYEQENAKHMASHLTMRYTQNWLPGGIEFLSNNVSEWMAEDYKTHQEKLFEAYINYNCFANPDYCEDQRNIDIRHEMRNDSTGYLIMGGNWYDERYEDLLGVNVGGLYPKTYRDGDSSFATVGFRYVIRPVKPVRIVVYR